MPYSYSKYRTTSLGEIEAMLEGANVVNAVSGYETSGVDRIVFGTTAGICAVERTSAGVNTKKGYVTLANVNDLAMDDTYCYVAYGSDNTNGGLGRIALDSLFGNTGDQTSGFDGDWGKDNGTFRSASTDMVCSVDSALIGEVWFLAYTFYVWGSPGVCRDVSVYNLSAGVSYWAYGCWGAAKVQINEAGDLFAVRGHQLVYKQDIHTVSGNDWFFDQECGNCDYVGTESILPFFLKSGSGTCVKNSDHVSIQWTPPNDGWCGKYQNSLFLTGDFDLRITGLNGIEPSMTSTGEKIERYLQIVPSDNTSDYGRVQVSRVYNSVMPNVRTKFSADAVFSGSSVLSTTTETGSSVPGNDWELRIQRTGSNLSFYYDQGAGWVQLGSTVSGWHTGSVYLFICQAATDLSGLSMSWDVYGFENADPQTCYELLDNSGCEICDCDLIRVTSGVTYSLVFSPDNGALICDWNRSDPEQSTVKSFGDSGSGKDYEILSSDACRCVAMEPGATTTSGGLWVGTADSGMDFVELYSNSSENNSASSQRVIDDQILVAGVVGSVAYGTGAGAATEGAGLLIVNDSVAPLDTELVTRGHSQDCIAVSWRKPVESDRHHSHLYRQKNDSGTWEYLTQDGSWGTSGSFYEFDTSGTDCESLLCAQAVELTDGKWTFKVTQVDDYGNESVGSQADEYIDEPNVNLGIYENVGSTDDRGVLVSLTGDSGDDSCNEVDQIHELQIKDTSQPWSDSVSILAPDSASPWILPFCLPGASGLKTLEARGLSRSGKIGTASNVNIRYNARSLTEFDSSDNMMIAHDFVSDQAATINGWRTDTGFDVENVQDPRLAKVWRAELNDESPCGVRFDLGDDPGQIDLFALKNHNLDVYDAMAGSGIRLWLCAGDSLPFATYMAENFLSNAPYKVELTSLITNMTICHRPEITYRYWAVIVESTTVAPLAIHPYFGRILLAQTTDIWQPEFNFDVDYSMTLKDPSIVHESEDQTLEAVVKDKRLEVALEFSNMSESDCRTGKRIFERVGRTDDLLALLRPSEIATGTTTPSAWSGSEDFMPPLYCQLAHDFSVRGRPAGKGSFSLELREIVGGRSPYGIRVTS